MRRIVTALFALVFTATATAQEGFQPATPGPEHEPLEKMVGTWDATVTMEGDEFPPVRGTMVYEMDLGGLWLIGRFDADFLGQKFEGIDTTGYCPIKKKYVNTWIDSMTKSPLIAEGTFDPETGKMTSTGMMPGEDGKKMVKNKTVSTFVTDDHMRMEMYTVGDDGTEVKNMTIDYKRKK